jgi:hypothetical protein
MVTVYLNHFVFQVRVNNMWKQFLSLCITLLLRLQSTCTRLFCVTIWICRWRMNTLVTSQWYQPRLLSITKILSYNLFNNFKYSLNKYNVFGICTVPVMFRLFSFLAPKDFLIIWLSNIPYNLIFTTKFNDSSILITIILCDYLNLSLADEHVGDVTIPTQVIVYNLLMIIRFVAWLAIFSSIKKV